MTAHLKNQNITFRETANKGLSSHDRDGRTSEVEIHYSSDESVVRETHRHDVINSSQSTFRTKSIGPFSPILSFKKNKPFYQDCPFLFVTP